MVHMLAWCTWRWRVALAVFLLLLGIRLLRPPDPQWTLSYKTRGRFDAPRFPLTLSQQIGAALRTAADDGRIIRVHRLFGDHAEMSAPVLAIKSNVTVPKALRKWHRHFWGRPPKHATTAAALAPAAAAGAVKLQADGLPLGFDWRAYSVYHPQHRLQTQQAAEEHYRRHGGGGQLLYQRIRVILRHTARGGLANQLYCQIAALALAAASGAEVVLPPSLARASFNHTSMEGVEWTLFDPDRILDVDAITRYWRRRGITVHPMPELAANAAEDAVWGSRPMYRQPELDLALVTTMNRTAYTFQDLPQLVNLLRRTAVGHAERLLRNSPGRPIPYVVVDAPILYSALRPTSCPQLGFEVAASLAFAPRVVAVAGKVVNGLRHQHGGRFNSVHLRIETDAGPWLKKLGGVQGLLNFYVEGMRGLDFRSDTPVYFASGADEGMAAAISQLQSNGSCGPARYKHDFLDNIDIEGLNLAQLALVDLLVAVEADKFVGYGRSSFSTYIVYHRLLRGHPLSTASLFLHSPQSAFSWQLI